MIEPEFEVDTVAAEATLGEDGGDFGGLLAGTETMRIHDHAGEPRRQRQRAQALTFISDPAIRIERAKLTQQAARLLQRGRRRRIEKGQRCGIAHAPLREVEHQRGEIGAENFGLRVGGERCGLWLVPQPIADAGFGTAGAAAALINRGARGANGFQSGQADVRLVTRNARHPGIDHDPEAFDGQRGLRDRGRQYHLAVAFRRRRDGAVLHTCIERTEQRHNLDRVIMHPLTEEILRAADFRCTRQERQH